MARKCTDIVMPFWLIIFYPNNLIKVNVLEGDVCNAKNIENNN